METEKAYSYIGKTISGTVVENIELESLTKNKVFIQRQLVLKVDDKTSFILDLPRYLELLNTTEGKHTLMNSVLPSNVTDCILNMWRDE